MINFYFSTFRKNVKRILSRNYTLFTLAMFLRNFVNNNRVEIKSDGIYRFHKNIRGSGNKVFIGKDSLIFKSNLKISGSNNKIFIGNKVRIGKNSTFRIIGNDLTIRIGDRTTTNSFIEFNAFNANIFVGDDCLFSNHIHIRTSDDHDILDRETNRVLNPSKDVIIGNKVWLAPESIVMKGVNVGEGAILATRTIVTHDVDPHTIVAGIPGKCVKSNIVWSHIKNN